MLFKDLRGLIVTCNCRAKKAGILKSEMKPNKCQELLFSSPFLHCKIPFDQTGPSKGNNIKGKLQTHCKEAVYYLLVYSPTSINTHYPTFKTV